MELREVAGFPDYKISDCGDVWSEKSGMWLKPAMNHKGYQIVGLRHNGKTIRKFVHRLVAETFIPNVNNYPQINHKNECKTDNRVDNLEWCTALYNNRYGMHNENQKRTNQENNGKPVLQIKGGAVIARFASIKEAARILKCNKHYISRVCRGIGKTYKGYAWRFAE